MSLILVSAGSPVLTVDDLRQHLAIVDETHLDETIAAVIPAAEAWVSDYTGRDLSLTTWDLVSDRFPVEHLIVPRGPLVSVTAGSSTYVDASGATTQIPVDTYRVDTESDQPVIERAYGKTWPTPRDEPRAVRFRIVTGYANRALIPPALLKAAMLVAQNLIDYEGTNAELRKAAEYLAWPHRLFG